MEAARHSLTSCPTDDTNLNGLTGGQIADVHASRTKRSCVHDEAVAFLPHEFAQLQVDSKAAAKSACVASLALRAPETGEKSSGFAKASCLQHKLGGENHLFELQSHKDNS